MPLITSYKILREYFIYGFFGLTDYGPLRSGKSVFAIKVLGEVYAITARNDWKEFINKPFEEWCEYAQTVEPDYTAWERWMPFLPEELLNTIDKVQAPGHNNPCSSGMTRGSGDQLPVGGRVRQSHKRIRQRTRHRLRRRPLHHTRPPVATQAPPRRTRRTHGPRSSHQRRPIRLSTIHSRTSRMDGPRTSRSAASPQSTRTGSSADYPMRCSPSTMRSGEDTLR